MLRKLLSWLNPPQSQSLDERRYHARLLAFKARANEPYDMFIHGELFWLRKEASGQWVVQERGVSSI